ncbi:MAG: hypothetical protein ACREV1_00080 [Gammaproteobacteria bacterium]
MSQSVSETIRVLINGAMRHRVAMVVSFLLVSCSVMLVGLSWPKRYLSYTTIYIDDTKTIQPFLVGAAAAARTELQDRARIARQILFSRKVFDEIFKVAGWADLSPEEKEMQGKAFETSTTIMNLGKNLVRIEYEDSDPMRTYAVTKKFGDSLISEILYAKMRGSEEALKFIESQLKLYRGKLVDAEKKLNDFRAKNPGVTPDAGAGVRSRVERLHETIENTNTELKEAQVRKVGLEQQLSGQSSAGIATVDANLERVTALEGQLADLRMKYHDDYPDIVSLKRQIEDVKRAPRTTNPPVARNTVAEGGVDLFADWRRELLDTSVLIRTLSVRLEETQRFLRDEQQRAHRIDEIQTQMTELQREYETNQASYRDLIRQRENARVTLELDQTPNLTFQIQEPASIPLLSIGLRFLHFMLAGIALGITLPLFCLWAYLNYHPRIRVRSLISEKLGLVVLETIPHYFSPRERRQSVVVNYCMGVVLILYMVAYATLGILRFHGLV